MWKRLGLGGDAPYHPPRGYGPAVMKLLTHCSTHYCSCSLTYILGTYDIPKHNIIDITYYIPTYCQFLIYIQTLFILVSCII